ncbi:hypothetical protein [Flavicella marina]|uniref:hypothetical protein n=1 Tax=Flavicella marina TaxID=1475951 RepID=UPI00126581AC|nr:hypothetical protein [Flavicella marina]
MKTLLRLSIVLLILMFNTQLTAQETASDFKSSKKSEKKWRFSITPYALFAAQSTDVGGESIRQNFNDLSSMTNWGFQIITTVRYDRFSFSFDGTFANLGGSGEVKPLKADLSIDQKIFDLKAGYKVYDNFKLNSDQAITGWSIDFSLGGKYMLNDVSLDYFIYLGDNLIFDGTFKKRLEWWDLMVGVNTKFIVSPKFLVSVAYNAGGFGIGNSSKFASDFTYINSFKVHKYVLVNAGFRSFGYDRFDDGVETNVRVLGPMLGVSAIF